MINLLKINLKKQAKLTEYSQIKVKKKIMIILGTPHLKMVVDRVEDLVDLADQIFQTFLKTFLEILEVAGEVEEEILVIKVQI